MENGDHISKIIGAHAERIDADTVSPPRQETPSFVFHIYQGSGYTLVGKGASQKKLEWTLSDTFAVPHYSHVQHFANEGETTYLFSFSDEPLMKNLDMYRKKQFEAIA